MKKSIFLSLCMVLLALSSFAQQKGVSKFKSEVNSTTIDTVVNATTKYQLFQSANAGNILTVQVTATKISGTTAGVVRLFGSNDKVAWVRVKEGAALAAVDSLNLANASTPQTIIFTEKPGRYLYYRVGITGSGTASTKFSSVAVNAR
ncbi:hypothetical protein LZD49_26420 [Dyadobacter sp. CY261]|uniref:hypothetical protein n=1 Tax=Dyadobacter sp. CY261 TaxID=2907203 RepID=UPI001F1FE233|nr:hypothetical protein [Dyadobacter sp. CY261]MCF0074045.1 hypothetical protein [Dyadobacter sp. CY261]